MADIDLSGEDRKRFVTALAEIYTTSAEADPALSAVGYPKRRRPSIEALRPDIAWNEIFQDFDNGVVAEPYRRLLTEVLGAYRHNRVFLDLAERHGVGLAYPREPSATAVTPPVGPATPRVPLETPIRPVLETPIRPVEEGPPQARDAPHICGSAVSDAGGRGVLAVAFSPDGRWLATGGTDGTARLWDAGRRECSRVLEHPAALPCAVFSPDSALLATACADSRVRLWDVGGGRVVHELVHDGALSTVAFSPDGRRLVAQAHSRDGSSALWWDVETGRLGRAPITTSEPNGDVAVSPDGRWAARTMPPNLVAVWADTDGSQRPVMIPHRRRVTTVRFSPDSRWLATVEYALPLRLWDPATLRPVLVTRHPVLAFDLSPDGRLLATWGSGGVIEVVDIPQAAGEPAHWRPASTGRMVEGSPTFDLSGRWLSFHSPAYRTVYLCDLNTAPVEVHRLRHDAEVSALAFHPGGRRLVAAAGRAVEWSLPAAPAGPMHNQKFIDDY